MTTTERYASTLAYPDGYEAAARMRVYITGPGGRGVERWHDPASTQKPTGYGVDFPDGSGVYQGPPVGALRKTRDQDTEEMWLREQGWTRHTLTIAEAAAFGLHMFVFDRRLDESGISGTGVVAFGCAFPDGQAATKWNGNPVSQTALWDDARADIPGPHGHGGSTVVRWMDRHGYTDTAPWERR